MNSDNYRRIILDIENACVQYGRQARDVKLIAVTKTVNWELAAALYAKGQRDFGESRVQEAIHKQDQAPNDCRWHLIGTLQSNKVRKVIGRFSLIHSVDSVDLIHKLSRISQEDGVTTSILLQANTSGEISKHGMPPQQWKNCFEELLNLPALSIDGLMTIAPLNDDERVIRTCFARLRHLRDELKSLAGKRASLHHLSMGMSHDFKWAIAEGATIVRIGSALFNT